MEGVIIIPAQEKEIYDFLVKIEKKFKNKDYTKKDIKQDIKSLKNKVLWLM